MSASSVSALKRKADTAAAAAHQATLQALATPTLAAARTMKKKWEAAIDYREAEFEKAKSARMAKPNDEKRYLAARRAFDGTVEVSAKAAASFVAVAEALREVHGTAEKATTGDSSSSSSSTAAAATAAATVDRTAAEATTATKQVKGNKRRADDAPIPVVASSLPS